MQDLKEKSQEAREKIDSQEYKKEISLLEEELHELRSKMVEVEKSKLQDLGYKPINIDNHTIMAPVGISFRKLYSSLQQTPVPDNNQKLVKYLVSEEDQDSVYESEEYNSVIEKRQKQIDEIFDIYEQFWKSEVKPIAESDEDAIIYMLVGLDRDIRPRKISNITGINRSKCRKYKLDDKTVKKRSKNI